MTSLSGDSRLTSLSTVVKLARRDRVRVPDGRVGKVIGFYRDGEEDLVLVHLESGATRRYARADVRLLIG